VAKLDVSGGHPGEPETTLGARRKRIVFVGFMAAGKSKAARRAADRIGGVALDSDAVLEGELGEPIAQFFDREGEAAFREREERLVLDLLDRPDATAIALGGGAVLSERVRERLRDELCVYMEIDGELAWERAHGPKRPLARDRDRFLELHAERTPLYESVARAVITSTNGDFQEGALDAVSALGAPSVPGSVRMAWARTEQGGYPVYVGEGAIDAAGALWRGGRRAFVVADEHVHALHGETLAAALLSADLLAGTITVPPGERHKALGEAERVLRELAQAGAERSDAILAFGGGVTGDLAGFCAAVYQRGVGIVQVPTTLVAQVDSAYGGKTGVDLPEAKNYVGSFHQPAAVITDPLLLSTLPERELQAGFAEVVKTGLIAGGALWDRVRTHELFSTTITGDTKRARDVIERCLRVKLAVVASDERDFGMRASLNLGHTFAHALESASGYSGYLHGEAVAVGLLVALRLSERKLGLDPYVRDEMVELLRMNGLPVSFGGPSTDHIVERVALDKKRSEGRHNFVLMRAPGDIAVGCEVSDQELREAVDEIREN
jgi:shikimate kinase/3-dehydroquinate synthase